MNDERYELMIPDKADRRDYIDLFCKLGDSRILVRENLDVIRKVRPLTLDIFPGGGWNHRRFFLYNPVPYKQCPELQHKPTVQNHRLPEIPSVFNTILAVREEEQMPKISVIVPVYNVERYAQNSNISRLIKIIGFQKFLLF